MATYLWKAHMSLTCLKFIEVQTYDTHKLLQIAADVWAREQMKNAFLLVSGNRSVRRALTIIPPAGPKNPFYQLPIEDTDAKDLATGKPGR